MPPDTPPDVVVGMWVLRHAAARERAEHLTRALAEALRRG